MIIWTMELFSFAKKHHPVSSISLADNDRLIPSVISSIGWDNVPVWMELLMASSNCVFSWIFHRCLVWFSTGGSTFDDFRSSNPQTWLWHGTCRDQEPPLTPLSTLKPILRIVMPAQWGNPLFSQWAIRDSPGRGILSRSSHGSSSCA